MRRWVWYTAATVPGNPLCVQDATLEMRGLQVAQEIHATEGGAGAAWDVQYLDKEHPIEVFAQIAERQKGDAAPFAEIEGSMETFP